MRLEDFYNLHRGETCLIVGGGPNLKLTPPEWFNYPAFGVNTVYRYEGWKPSYFVGVDHRLMVEDGAAIVERYRDIPKFFPRPDFDELQGENIYRFAHRYAHGDLYVGGQLANQREALTKHGITYYKIMDAVLQIAFHMGFTTMLMIGVQHKPASTDEPDADREHFWGLDAKAHKNQLLGSWFIGYSTFSRMMAGAGVRVLNISEDTYVPEDVLARDDWRNWKNT